jgi:hypothetical protein
MPDKTDIPKQGRRSEFRREITDERPKEDSFGRRRAEFADELPSGTFRIPRI